MNDERTCCTGNKSCKVKTVEHRSNKMKRQIRKADIIDRIICEFKKGHKKNCPLKETFERVILARLEEMKIQTIVDMYPDLYDRMMEGK